MPTSDGASVVAGRLGVRARAAVPPVLVGLAALVLATLLYRPWGWRRTVPMSAGFDVRLHALLADLALHGQVAGTDRLGAPFGLHLGDFAVGGDRLSLWLCRAIGVVVSDPFTVVNVAFLLSFAFTAAAGYLVADALGLRRRVAAAVGLVHGFLPYHFAHDAQHVFLANYAALTLVVLVAIWTIRDELGIPGVGMPFAHWRAAERRRCAAVAIIVVLGASTGGYYAAFAIVLVAGAGLLALARTGRWRALGAAAVVVTALAVVLLINLAPDLAWRARHGVNHEVAARTVGENERYALHVTQVILPGAEHRVDALASLGERARAGEQPGEPGQYVGVIAALGLLGAVGSLVARGLGRRNAADPTPNLDVAVDSDRDASTDPDADASTDPDADRARAPVGDEALIAQLGALALWVVLVATVGGLGFTLAVAGVTQFRAWDRLGVVLGLLGLLAAGTWATRRLDRVTDRRRGLATALIALVVIVALLDQIPGTVRPDVNATHRHLDAVRGLVATMESDLARDAMVFQLPVATFPEAGPTGAMADYSLLEPHLLGSRALRWSYGGMRGRAQDWQLAWAQQPLVTFVTGLAAAGYDALYVDRRAYADDGASLDAQLQPLTGPARMVSADGTVAWYDLRPRRHALVERDGLARIDEAGARILNAVVPRPDGDIGPNEAALTTQQRWLGAHGTLELANPLAVPRDLVLRLQLHAPTPATVAISGVGDPRRVALDGEATVDVAVPVRLEGNEVIEVTLEVSGRTIPGVAAGFEPKVRISALVVDEPAVLSVAR